MRPPGHVTGRTTARRCSQSRCADEQSSRACDAGPGRFDCSKREADGTRLEPQRQRPANTDLLMGDTGARTSDLRLVDARRPRAQKPCKRLESPANQDNGPARYGPPRTPIYRPEPAPCKATRMTRAARQGRRTSPGGPGAGLGVPVPTPGSTAPARRPHVRSRPRVPARPPVAHRHRGRHHAGEPAPGSRQHAHHAGPLQLDVPQKRLAWPWRWTRRGRPTSRPTSTPAATRGLEATGSKTRCALPEAPLGVRVRWRAGMLTGRRSSDGVEAGHALPRESGARGGLRIRVSV